MPVTVTLELEELKRQRQKHQIAIERLDWMINNLFNVQDTEISSQTRQTEEIEPVNGMGRMKMALKICEDYLKSGKKVRTMREFLNLLEKKQIKLSRGGLGLAFKSSDSHIEFDKDAQEWKLKI